MSSGAAHRVTRALLRPAVADWILATYLLSVIAGLAFAEPQPARNQYIVLAAGVLVVFLSGVYLYRLHFERRGPPTYFARLAYHLLPMPCILGVYFNLRPILPIINPTSYDARLHQLDVRLFGAEPTLALERFISPRVVEFFAFFYYSYFFFIASFIFVIILTVRNEKKLAYFSTGLLFVLGVGHFVYTLVPGLGPYAHLAHEYEAPLRGGPFYDLVLQTVSAGGPMRDIFPSLHTALPLFCTLFAWRYYRRFGLLATVFSVNIMIATVVLRWHYAVDVIAGVILATAASLLAPRMVESYQRRREAAGLAFLRRW